MSKLLKERERAYTECSKKIANFMKIAGVLLILATISRSNIADEHHLHDGNRTCIPAEAESILVSSGCYPLVNFTRPFCQNHGITLPGLVYRRPYKQRMLNNEANKVYDSYGRLGVPKISRLFNVDNDTLIKCMHASVPSICHVYFPSCDGTLSKYRERKICRKNCLNVIHICRHIWDYFEKVYRIRFPNTESRKLVRCELQPYRNAGDSPECWYSDLEDSTAAIPAPEWTTNADCLYLNGSSYHGNISVTASGIACQSWTEQCPHRHTMNTTYPELNNAKNYCRNPKNSGQRPWCFTTDRNKRWENCDIPNCTPVDGNYGNWFLSSACNVTCGEGFETWTRHCDNPELKFGGRNCSHLGDTIEYRPCQKTPCPVNGGYSSWSLSAPCNVSCGEGMEIWRRSCDNPEPKYGGSNCNELGRSTELRKCRRILCPVDGKYGNWTKLSPCSATCGQGVEIWVRNCDNPPGKYGGNCSKQGADHENRLCEKEPCQVVSNSKTIGFIVAATFVIVVVILGFSFIRRNRCRKRVIPFYAIVKFSSDHVHGQHEPQVALLRCTAPVSSEERTNTSQETGNVVVYQNLTGDGNPIPG